mmetsp:Transcript_5913/g.9820  ORF Transcript_5913/g.9820 Transcript_5913/m.9820 type:complete len:344 (+) Transcript_5913:161-1192(+)|eukprot:jgi/Bigna1/67038/fgenesh1_pg.2_\
MGACASDSLEEEGVSYQLLLLGAGSSGKSTICKQIRLMYGHGLDGRLLHSFTSLIRGRMIESMQTLLQESTKRSDSKDSKFAVRPENAAVAETVLKLEAAEDSVGLTKKVALDIKQLWEDPGIQNTHERRAEFNIPENTAYFMSKIEEISDPEYLASTDDALRISSKTSGLVTTHFEYNGTGFTLIDVGGQESERRKWAAAFKSATSVLFIAAISSYDQYYFDKKNKLVDALELFEQLVNLPELSHTSFVLFLNKIDVFKEKIGRTPINVCPALKGYQGNERDINAATSYIEQKFLEKGKKKESNRVFSHITCAIDQKNVRKIFESVIQTVIGNALTAGGLIG